MSENNVKQDTRTTIELLSDRQLTPGREFNWGQCRSAALWVVEQRTSIDSHDTQSQAVHDGRDVLVCSFLRHSVASIGACRHYVGSLATVSAASGISVHCHSDLLRAARELRGRLSAQTVSVLDESELLIVSLDQSSKLEIGTGTPRELLANVLFAVSGHENFASSAA